MGNIALESIKSVVENQAINFPALGSALAKARKPLAAYAESRGTTYSKLKVIDICEDVDRHKIAHAVTFFLNKSPLPKEKVRDAKSRIKYVLKNLIWEESHVMSNDDSQTVVPDFLRPVLAVIPRYAGGAAKHNNGGAQVTETRSRLNLPVSEAGQRMLTVLLAVVEENSITDMDSLIIHHRSDIYRKVRELHPPNKVLSVTSTFTYIRKRLGYPSFKELSKSSSIALEDFPPKLREEMENFLKNAPHGFKSNPSMRRKAEQKEITIKCLEESTVNLYLATICRFLGKIKFDDYESIEIKSFLKIEVEQAIDEEGVTYSRLFNSYIEQVREIEMSRESDRRETGYDSSQFGGFLTAIKSVAVFNGIFHLHELFNKAYKIVSDKRSVKLRKEAKKRVFDTEWIDGEIIRLRKEFKRIIREKSFKISEKSANYSETAGNLRLCMFYVKFVILRYMGFRQQCLRNCRVNHNVFFEEGGVIRFFWGVDEIKNDRELSARLDPKKHSDSHGVLIETLNLYYKHIYPFIRQRSAKQIQGQLIVSMHDSSFHPYRIDSSSNFHQTFRSQSMAYLEFGDRLKEFPSGLHPHFFRGFCSDWLVKHLGISQTKAARFIGDSERTFVREYLDNNIGFDAGDALDEANENLRIRKKAENEAADSTITKNELAKKHQSEVARKDTLIEELTESLKRTREENITLKNKLSELSIN